MAGRGQGGRGRGGREQGGSSRSLGMEIDPKTGTPVSGVTKRKHPLLLSSPPPERLETCATPGSKKEFHEILGDIDDKFPWKMI